ncbi:MAG: hypothetical protein IJW30_05855 [Clostridia bacterium]|nr:hypothetical protein [Clostridia bacterium]
MKKFTRRSYNRKLVVFGLSIFMAISLISVGFSAWVMSAINDIDTGTDAENVQVAIVKDAMLEISLDQWQMDESVGTYKWSDTEILCFDAKADDATGRVVYEGETDEKLTMKISGSVSNASILKGFQMSITIPEELRTAIAQNYIKLADGTTMDGEGVITIGSLDAVDSTAMTWGEVDAEGNQTFEYVLTFEWGAYFGNMNPCEFYDSDSASVARGVDGADILGSAISNAQMRTEMNTFRSVMTNGADTAATYTGCIRVIIKASTN